jgi:predicted transcriptional regulator
MCPKSSTNRHDVWQKHLKSKLNLHPPQVTQNISARLKIQIKTFIKETKSSITMAYIVSLYRNCSLHILNQWITDPAVFKDMFKYQHYYYNDEFEYYTIMSQHKQPFAHMLPVWRVCFSSVNNGHLLTAIRYQTVMIYSTACVPLVKNIINTFVNIISNIQICTEF